MPSKKGKKGKKGKKTKQRMKKFNLDLFGLLTFTRYHGAPFEEFMYTPEKKNQAKKGMDTGGKGKGKKKKKPVEIPKLMKFPPVPEDPSKMRKLKMAKKTKDPPDAIITSMNVGYPERTARPRIPLQEGGSIRDVICKKTFPLLPRPQPHGGVYANVKCVVCASTGGLLKTVFGLLHKKMRTLLNKQFEKAKFILEWTTARYEEMSKNFLKHIGTILEEMGPTLDNLDENEWEDHQNVRAWKEKYRQLQKDLAALRMQLKRLRKNRDEALNERLADKLAELREAERQMLALEAKVAEARRMLDDWTQNKDAKINGPKAEIERLKELLQRIKQSIIIERDTLRELLKWEMQLATESTIKKMEEILRQDLDEVQTWLHTAWFRLFLENRRMQEERSRLRVENHLLALEVQALTRQVGQMEVHKREVLNSRTHFITPPSLQAQVDRFVKTGARPRFLELHDYPPTKFVHE